MKRLSIKTSGFSSDRQVFFRNDGTFEILSSETLPEGFLFGVEASETGILSSSIGAFYILVSDTNDVEVSVLWSNWSGSSPDGLFFYNNTDVVPSSSSTSEDVYDSGTTWLNYGVGSLVDFGLFFVFAENQFDGTKVFKASKDFSSVTELSFPELESISIFDSPIISSELGGVLYLGVTIDGTFRYGTLYLVNVYEETLQVVPVEVVLPPIHTGSPRNRLNAVLQYPGNKICVVRELETLVYQYENGTLNFLYAKDWSLGDVENSFSYQRYPLLNIYHTQETLYIFDIFGLRAIDSATDEIRWAVAAWEALSGGWFFNGAAAISPVTGNFFVVGQNFPDIFLQEYDRATGALVNSWNIEEEFLSWGAPHPFYVDSLGRVHMADGDKIVVFDPDSEAFLLVVDAGDISGIAYFDTYGGRPIFLKNGYVLVPVEDADYVYWYNSETLLGGVFAASGWGQWQRFPIASEGSVYYATEFDIKKISFT